MCHLRTARFTHQYSVAIREESSEQRKCPDRRLRTSCSLLQCFDVCALFNDSLTPIVQLSVTAVLSNTMHLVRRNSWCNTCMMQCFVIDEFKSNKCTNSHCVHRNVHDCLIISKWNDTYKKIRILKFAILILI